MQNNSTLMRSTVLIGQKPPWINKKINLRQCVELKQLLEDFQLDTVCQQALCPNIAECFAKRCATFLILGNICTRQCSFCAIGKGTPQPLDENEPYRISCAVARLGLRHVVVTSVTRDDLVDKGAGAFVATIRAIQNKKKNVAIEVLVPDFGGACELIEMVVNAAPRIFAHNLETVPALYPLVRKGADYERSLRVLAHAKKINNKIFTKSGIMVGLGEREEEVLEAMHDLQRQGCDFISIGQYLAPRRENYPVQEYIRPEQFERYKAYALQLGFLHVESAPYVRSSYEASDYLKEFA